VRWHRLILVIGTLACSTPCWAEGTETPAAQVERLAREATAAYKAADYPKAIALLERACQIQKVANLLYNLARSYEKAGEGDKAIDYYQRYLDAPDAEPKLKTKAEARIIVLREAAEASRPRPVEPPPVIEPPPGVVERPPPPPIERPTIPPPPPPPAHPALVDHGAQRHAQVRRRDRTLGLTMGAIGLVMAGAATGLAVNALLLHDQFLSLDAENDKRATRDAAQANALAADLLFAGAVASVAVGIVFLYRGFRHERPHEQPQERPKTSQRLLPWVGHRVGGMIFEGRF
jgi:tetratricopeptide (TPR) repeat protein